MPATAPADLATLVLPANLDTMPRRDIVAFFEANGLSPISPRQSAESLRTLLRDVTTNARCEREAEARNAEREESEERRAHIHAQVLRDFTYTQMPRRTISDALDAVNAAAGGGFASQNDSDGREARLLWAIDRLVMVLREAAEPYYDMTLEDALREAAAAEETAAQVRREAARARANIENRLRGILRTLEEGR